MLILNQWIEAKWVPASRQWYEDKGYEFTGYRKSFYVKAEDLPLGSHKKVKVKCDYCGKIIEKDFVLYLKEAEKGHDCCPECAHIKRKENVERKYGCSSYIETEEFKQKAKKTNLERYGFENPAQSNEVKAKIARTNMERYGDICTLNSPEIKEKATQTMLERYGVENIFQLEEMQERIRQDNLEKYGVINPSLRPDVKEKIINTNMEKYGVPYSTQAPEVIEKMRETLYQNGTTPSSKAERKMVEIIKEIYGEENCVHNYAVGNCSLDCYLEYKGLKFDIEYDGWYWHKNKQEKDKRRNYWLSKQGWRILRFRANDAIPTPQQIKDGVNYLIQTGHLLHYVNLDIDI